jgi:hypothetical protein
MLTYCDAQQKCQSLDLPVTQKTALHEHFSLQTTFLLQPGLLSKLVPAKVNVHVSRVANAAFSDDLHDGKLQAVDKEKNLVSPCSQDGVHSAKTNKAIGEPVKQVASAIAVAQEVESSKGGDLAKECKLVMPVLAMEAVKFHLQDEGGEEDDDTRDKNCLFLGCTHYKIVGLGKYSRAMHPPHKSVVLV